MKVPQITAFFKNSRFGRNFFSIAAANLVSQCCLLAATPLLSRLFLPSDFGLAALFLSVLQVIASFSTWRFDRSVPNTGSRLAASMVVMCGFFSLNLICLLTLSWVYLELNHFSMWKEIGDIGPLLYLLPVAILFTGLLQLGNAWFARETVMRAVGVSVIVYTVSYLIVALLSGWLNMGYAGLIVAAVFALSFRFLAMLKYISIDGLWRRFSLKKVFTVFKKYRWLSSISSVVTLVNALSLSAPVFLLSMNYSVADVGIFALVFRILGTPLGILTKALSLSFWSEAADLIRQKKYRNLQRIYLKVSALLFCVAVVVSVLSFFAAQLIEPLLGENWQGAGAVTIALIPYLFGVIVVSPTNHLWVLKRHELQLFADCCRLLLMAASIYIAHEYEWGLSSSVLALALSSLAGHLILFSTHLVLHNSRLRLSS